MNKSETVFFMDTLKYLVIDNKLRLAWEFDDGDTWTLTFKKL